ncbi:heterokaryon incompatibility protein-domain-containing protein [Paraphoma chrysanthemicola]|nr:heterokaryon incompatibility protein-domain-containing protein [Paraphoma chrysanthemicola]
MESCTAVESDEMAVFATTRDDAKHEIQGSICDRCYSIPWENLAFPSESLQDTGYDLTLETREQLRASTCPVCHLFERVASTNDLNSRTFKLTWFDSPYNGPSIGTLTLLQSKFHEPAPHIIATDMTQDNAQSYLRKIYPRTLDIDLAKTWINECASQHRSLCNPPISARPKHITKFIDCEQRIVVTGSTECLYVALSYVWGHSSTAQSDVELEPTYTELDRLLPQTIEDSIVLTKALGIKYLWVDRYCIDQNDAKSKHEQIQQMGVIYSSAHLTIIAAAGEDPLYGLPGIRDCSRMDTFSVRVRSVTLAVHPLRSQVNLDVLASSWASRAWTFQECYLSRRRLFFTDTQAQFVCNSCFGPELDRSTQSDLTYLPWEQVNKKLDNYTATHPLDVILPPDVTNTYAERGPNLKWNGMIQATRYLEVYSSRQLSYDSDALEAIVGALNTLREREMGDRIFHIWGMPVCPIDGKELPLICTVDEKGSLSGCNAIKMGLFWYHKSPARRRQMFPSWSSLEWQGPISWQYHELDGDEHGDKPTQEINIYQRVAFLETGVRIFSKGPGYAMLRKTNFGGDGARKALQLRAMTVDVRLAALDVTSDANESCGSKVVKAAGTIVIPYDTTTEMLVRVYWDIPPTDLDPKQKLKGIIFHSSWEKAGPRDIRYGSSWHDPMMHPMMIARETRSGKYERVGLCWLPVHYSQHRKLPVQFCTRSSSAKVSPGFFGETPMLEKLSYRNSTAKTAETASSEESRHYGWGKRVCKLESFLLE